VVSYVEVLSLSFKNIVFWSLTPCNLVVAYRYVGLLPQSLHIYTEKGGSRFL
jgi:hypothetical protein